MGSLATFGCFKEFVQAKRDAFETFYPELIKLLKESDELAEANDWFETSLSYNLPHGKKSRGLLTVCTQYYLNGKKDSGKVEEAIVLGWCVELVRKMQRTLRHIAIPIVIIQLQACCLVADDIMDNSILRRGRPCWYKCDGVGMTAFNDAFYLESSIYAVLKSRLRDLPFYMEIVELFHEVTRKTIYGQNLDFLNTKLTNDITKRFALSNTLQISKFKTSYYTFYLPLRTGMILAGANDKLDIEIVETVCTSLGQIFQANDDFLDVFADPLDSGKIGTDIAEGKCTWLICKSLEVASPDQKTALLANYGRGEDNDRPRIVKEIMTELDLPSLFEKYVNEEKTKIRESFGHLRTEGLKEVFELLLNDI